MDYQIAKLLHVIGFTMLGAGLIGVFVADLRSRQLGDLSRFSESILFIRMFYNLFTTPGAILVLAAGAWMIFAYDMPVMSQPWLLGMIILFAFEFIEGNTITRAYFIKLIKECQIAAEKGLDKAPDLEDDRGPWLATFTHYLDLPLFFTIVSLGVMRPTTWTQLIIGVGISIVLATILTVMVPRIFPWPKLVDDVKREALA